MDYKFQNKTISKEEFQDLLNMSYRNQGIDMSALEKDYWLCVTLNELFKSTPHLYTFKGGTCLSKVYNAISRFSEDIDITINPIKAGIEQPKFQATSKTKLKLEISNYRERICDYIQKEFYPNIKRVLEPYGLESSLNGNDVYIKYPVLTSLSEPILPYIKIEPGALAPVKQVREATISPYMCKDTSLSFDVAVNAMSPERIFWEKATILHKECFRDSTPARYSRHYYDFYKLLQSPFRDSAVNAFGSYANVITFKDTFFAENRLKYADIHKDGIRLIPSNTDKLKSLEEDYSEFSKSFPFVNAIPTFDEIISTLRTAETTLNKERKNMFNFAQDVFSNLNGKSEKVVDVITEKLMQDVSPKDLYSILTKHSEQEILNMYTFKGSITKTKL